MLNFLLIILVICGISLSIYIFYWLQGITRRIDHITKEADELYKKSLPILDDIAEVSAKANKVSSEVEVRIGEIIEVVDRTKEKFAWIVKSDEQQRPLQPVENLVNKFKALSKGISAFFYKLK